MANKEIQLPMEDIIKDYYNGMSIEQLSYKYYVHETTIRNRFKQLKIPMFLKTKKLNDAPLEEVINYYIKDNLSARKLANIYKVDVKTIIKYLKNHNIAIRTAY